MYRPHWLKFTWKLKELPAEAPTHAVKAVELRKAEAPDAAPLWAMMERAFSTEMAWGMLLPERLKHLREAVHEGIEQKSTHFLVIEHGRRIIGGSGVLKESQAEAHLLTGICVMEEYRCRGLGAWLLYHSLRTLADAGLPEASVVTRSNTAAARYLYPKAAPSPVKVDGFPAIKVS